MKLYWSILFFSTALAQQLCGPTGPNCMLENQKPKNSNPRGINVFGETIKICSLSPLTGFYRNGTCHSDSRDSANHSVCATLTKSFLVYTKARGNDLSSPNPRYQFPGLSPGDRWCLCASRWKEAYQSGIKTEVDWDATSIRALEVVNHVDLEGAYNTITCSDELYQKQLQVLKQNHSLSKRLKIIVLPNSQIKNKCQLINLAGRQISSSTTTFSTKKLEQVLFETVR